MTDDVCVRPVRLFIPVSLPGKLHVAPSDIAVRASDLRTAVVIANSVFAELQDPQLTFDVTARNNIRSQLPVRPYALN